MFITVLGLEWDKVSQVSFGSCDTDKNLALDREEFGSCISRYLNNQKDSSSSSFLQESKEDLDKLYTLVDLNHDAQVNLEEYAKMFTRAQHPTKAREQVEVQTKDGRTRRMSHEDLFAQIREQTKGFKMVDGKLYREVEKTEKKNQVDPQISRFLDLGVWAQQSLQALGWGWGKLNRLRSLSENKDSMLVAHDQLTPYSLVIELSILPSDDDEYGHTHTHTHSHGDGHEHDDDGEKSASYILHIDYNRDLYPSPPHYSLRQVKEGEGVGERVLWTAPPSSPIPSSSPTITSSVTR
ncbi:hypothetical protein EON65_43930 [archaeon]|nr:MAG: hypothetical protein EON65_43930 [archaeon]